MISYNKCRSVRRLLTLTELGSLFRARRLEKHEWGNHTLVAIFFSKVRLSQQRVEDCKIFYPEWTFNLSLAAPKLITN